jgi:hypothetical protein
MLVEKVGRGDVGERSVGQGGLEYVLGDGKYQERLLGS